MSDGSNTWGRSPEQAVGAAKQAEIPVSTIAFGTDSGFIELEGHRVVVPVNHEQLRGHRRGHRRQLLRGRLGRGAVQRLPRPRQPDRLHHRAARGRPPGSSGPACCSPSRAAASRCGVQSPVVTALDSPTRALGVVQQVSTRAVYRNRWISVREDEVRRPDGSPGIYSVIDKADFALVVPAERTASTWSSSTATRSAGGTGSSRRAPRAAGAAPAPEDAGPGRAGRGDRAAGRAMELLGHLHCAYGMSSQGFDVFLATELTPGPPAREDSEQDMRQRRVARAEFEAMVRAGRVTDDSTLAAYALLLMREAGRL